MDQVSFEALVAKALKELPVEFRDRLENVDVVVAEQPTPGQLAKMRLRHGTLLGLYEGIPITRRGGHYNLALPDKITLFQKPIESRCRNEGEIAQEIKRVLLHEIGHHFGIGEAKLREIERERRKKG